MWKKSQRHGERMGMALEAGEVCQHGPANTALPTRPLWPCQHGPADTALPTWRCQWSTASMVLLTWHCSLIDHTLTAQSWIPKWPLKMPWMQALTSHNDHTATASPQSPWSRANGNLHHLCAQPAPQLPQPPPPTAAPCLPPPRTQRVYGVWQPTESPAGQHRTVFIGDKQHCRASPACPAGVAHSKAPERQTGLQTDTTNCSSTHSAVSEKLGQLAVLLWFHDRPHRADGTRSSTQRINQQKHGNCWLCNDREVNVAK